MNRSRRHNSGHTLMEAMMASFLALVCALIFAATIPVANVTRGKAEYLNLATSLAQKQIEAIRHMQYPNTTAQRLFDNDRINSMTQINIGTLGVGTTGEMAYDASDVDTAETDSPRKLLPGGRGFVQTTQQGLDMRRVSVIVAWRERGEWRTVRVSTLVANL